MNVWIGRGLRPWRRFAWAALTGLAGALLGLTPAPAVAGTGLITTPADKFVMAPGGVDLRTGRYAYSQTDVAIGGTDESGGLALTRIMDAAVLGHVNPFDNFSHNWDIMITEKRISINDPSAQTGGDYRIIVHFGGRSKTFDGYQSLNGFTQKGNGPWGTLTFSGDRASASVVYTYTAPDGTVAVFRPLGNSDCSTQVRCAYVSNITEPDGTTLTFGYGTAGGFSGGAVQLHQVVSSRGYALLLEGSGNLVTKACVLNLTQTIVPANGLCPANAAATSSYAYNASFQRLGSVTRPGGAIESFTYANTASGLTMGFIKPGQATPWLTNTIVSMYDEDAVQQEIVNAQAFADGQSYSYGFQETPTTDNAPTPSIMGGSYTDALGHQTIVAYDFPLAPGGPQPGDHCLQFPCFDQSPSDAFNRVYQATLSPVQITDPLGRVTTADYCDPGPAAGLPSYEPNRCVVVPMVSFTDPEGIKTDLTYDGSLNITRAVRHAKAGSGLPDIVTSATYDVNHPKSHDKPLTTTDANGNTTTYTYDPNHGGVLTETDPAVNGVTPQKRYTYAQRYAWISDGGLGFVRAATPVWVLTQMSFCKAGNPNSTNTGCANGASDEVISTYDYGPDAGPNNLNLRGTVVDAGGLSLRSCTSYDVLGNKISETKPRAGLASCP